ncbi:hypothetical protein LPW36_03645 [Jinshanibacter sp. LJY008]|uniref:Uncharacterized protein n=1 Tax=Limnobaculum eriocheiris TaxID=2897391 RepID=A0A9X1MU88_9GAMM|nr:hypothetical protein [Limnobaculum eriocheiris]MCD1125129.1 hypothetical protein [Limnobaculum eriocheiris]
MSSALKALKKLRKKASKHGSKSKAGDRALQNLVRPAVLPNSHPRATKPETTDSIWSELSQEVMGNMLVEVSKPLKPLLDWFDHGGYNAPASRQPVKTGNVGNMRIQSGSMAPPAILRLPFKSPPCKRCPAKSGGICQCAAKRFA